MKWGSDTTFNKLTLASFLHDICLTNNDLAAISTLEELDKEKAKFTKQEYDEFKQHPVFAAEMAKKMSEVPPDVDVIIRQHHEKPDGTGFPRGLGHAYIAPLACVFIVAHDLARFTLKSGKDFKIEAFIESAREKYKSAQFKKVMSCIEMMQMIKGAASSIKS
jgi:response regulator RpfG family c-di-GMP phosphodiesterase